MKTLLLLFTLFIIIYNSSLPLLHPEFELANPISTSLTNGNFFIINKYGVYICDKSLSSIEKTSLSFSTEDQLAKEDLSKVIISKVEDNALICLIKDVIYIFDNQGNFLSKSKVLGLYDGPPGAYTLFGVQKSQYSYDFYIGFALNNKLFLQYYEYKIDYQRFEITIF